MLGFGDRELDREYEWSESALNVLGERLKGNHSIILKDKVSNKFWVKDFGSFNGWVDWSSLAGIHSASACNANPGEEVRPALSQKSPCPSEV